MESDTILVVEDNDVLRDGLHEMLTFEGFTVMTARNGVEALEQMESTIPVAIVSDISMPHMDGYDFFKAVRARSEWVTIPFIFLTAHSDPADIQTGRGMGVEDYLTKPLSREELVTAVRARLARSRQVEMGQLQQAYQASLTALANAIDQRDPYTGGHVDRVTQFALILAEHLGWHQRRIESLRFGAILHDIGKIHIGEATLFKKGPLNEEEWGEIKRHPVTGAEMIKDIPFLTEAVPIVRSHHERWDGQGYPDRLAGEEIPEGARIVSVVDSFDAMITVRPYRPASSLEQAYAEIQDQAGVNYDPRVVGAMKKSWTEGQIQAVAVETRDKNPGTCSS